MKAVLKLQIDRLNQLLAPKLIILKARWVELLPRERLLVLLMAGVAALSVLYLMVDGLVKYKQGLQRDIISLNQFSLYSVQSEQIFKQLAKVNVNKVSQPTIDQIKSDVKQVLAIDNPNVSMQDGQLTINVPNAQFNQIMTLLDQFRRSYGLFPDQINIIRQAQAGYVSFNATFWVNQ